MQASARAWLAAGLVLAGTLSLLPGARVAEAHGGIFVTGQNPLTLWNLNPWISLSLFLAAYLYVTGLQRWPRPSHPVNGWQRASFFAGLLVFFLALESPIDPLAEHLFAVHQVQHMMLRMLGPLLVLLGAPLTPMLRGLPPSVLKGVVRPLVRNPIVRRGYDLLTNPVVTSVLFLATMYVWQVPGPHNLGLRHRWVHEVMHFNMWITGLLFWWLVIDPKPHRSRLHYGLRVLYLGLVVIPNTVLGAGITFARHRIYEGYGQVGQHWNLDPMTDQQLGGLLLWVPGDMMSIMAAGIVMIMWMQREEAKERAIAT